MNTSFPHLPLLDHLRPEPGWQTDAAVLSTYSAQMPVVAAVLLALSGEADESGSGTRVGLVRALTGLRGKVHVVLQSGRLSQGKHDAAITGLFDQFLLQVPWDESAGPEGKSWHAKFALIRQVPIDPKQGGERWVFLLGVTDRPKGATEDRRNGATSGWLKRDSNGVSGCGVFGVLCNR